jgi:transposase
VLYSPDGPLGACPESRHLRSDRGPTLDAELLLSSEGGLAVAMGEARTKGSARQIAMVCVDELVPADDRYRRIDELVGDWGFVREAARPYYSEGIGRPSVDPTVLLKLMLAGALEGIGSMRELLRVAALRLDLRLFLGYGLGERLPAHQTISEAQTQRFADGDVFERLFLRTVALCKEHGLIEGSHLSVDGFHVEANAALRSLRASLQPLAGEAADEPAAEDAPAPAAPQLRLAAPRSGPTPKRKAANATAVSTTDPDARLKGKPGQRPHLVYRGHVAVDPEARCIVSCVGERAEGHEGDGLAPILDRARFAVPKLASVGTDQGYAAERVWENAAARGLVAYVPPQKTMLPTGGEPRTNAQRLALVARARTKSERGLWAYRQRMADAEGVIAELKNLHGLGRVRCRGTPAFHVQLLVGSAAVNLKRLAAHAPTGQTGIAAATEVATANPTADTQHHGLPTRQRATVSDNPTLFWTLSLCLN